MMLTAKLCSITCVFVLRDVSLVIQAFLVLGLGCRCTGLDHVVTLLEYNLAANTSGCFKHITYLLGSSILIYSFTCIGGVDA